MGHRFLGTMRGVAVSLYLWSIKSTCSCNGALQDSSVLPLYISSLPASRHVFASVAGHQKVDSLSLGNLSLMNNSSSANDGTAPYEYTGEFPGGALQNSMICTVSCGPTCCQRYLCEFEMWVPLYPPGPCKRSQRGRHQAKKQQTLEKMIRAQASWTHHLRATKILPSKETETGHLNLQETTTVIRRRLGLHCIVMHNLLFNHLYIPSPFVSRNYCGNAARSPWMKFSWIPHPDDLTYEFPGKCGDPVWCAVNSHSNVASTSFYMWSAKQTRSTHLTLLWWRSLMMSDDCLKRFKKPQRLHTEIVGICRNLTNTLTPCSLDKL